MKKLKCETRNFTVEPALGSGHHSPNKQLTATNILMHRQENSTMIKQVRCMLQREPSDVLYNFFYKAGLLSNTMQVVHLFKIFTNSIFH